MSKLIPTHSTEFTDVCYGWHKTLIDLCIVSVQSTHNQSYQLCKCSIDPDYTSEGCIGLHFSSCFFFFFLCPWHKAHTWLLRYKLESALQINWTVAWHVAVVSSLINPQCAVRDLLDLCTCKAKNQWERFHPSGTLTAVLMVWTCRAAHGTISQLFIDDVTADGSNRMNSEVYVVYALLNNVSKSRFCALFFVLFPSFISVWNQAAEGPLGPAGPGSGSRTWSSHADSPHVGETEQYFPGSGRIGLWALWASQASQVQRAWEAHRYLSSVDFVNENDDKICLKDI